MLIKHLLSFCLNLVRFEDHKLATAPNGLATGFLIAKGNRKFVVTAGHAARRDAMWFWETNVVLESERSVLCIPIGPFTLIESFTLSGTGSSEISEMDVGWCELDTSAIERHFRQDLRLKGKPLEFQVYQGPLNAEPVVRTVPYSFVAWNRTTLIPLRGLILERQAAYESCMTFTGTNLKGEHVFKLARKHQGHDYYSGSSGAPIAAPDGTIVSMVIGGSKTANEIYGFPFARLAHLFDLT